MIWFMDNRVMFMLEIMNYCLRAIARKSFWLFFPSIICSLDSFYHMDDGHSLTMFSYIEIINANNPTDDSGIYFYFIEQIG